MRVELRRSTRSSSPRSARARAHRRADRARACGAGRAAGRRDARDRRRRRRRSRDARAMARQRRPLLVDPRRPARAHAARRSRSSRRRRWRSRSRSAPTIDDLRRRVRRARRGRRGDARASARVAAIADDVDRRAVRRRHARSRTARSRAHRSRRRPSAAPRIALLYRDPVKPQDNAITRYLYRPVSFPLTRLLAWTPITPNQISYVVARARRDRVLAHRAREPRRRARSARRSCSRRRTSIAATARSRASSCCRRGSARGSTRSSTSCRRSATWSRSAGTATSRSGRDYFGDARLRSVARRDRGRRRRRTAWTIYCIYYNIIVAVGSANSQDYVGSFEVVPGRAAERACGSRPTAATRSRPARAAAAVVAWLATYAPYIVRRDFISWGATLLAAASLTQSRSRCRSRAASRRRSCASIDHARLRALRRSVRRAGHVLESP